MLVNATHPPSSQVDIVVLAADMVSYSDPTPNAGLFGDVVSTLNPACSGAGPEVDGPLRDMPVAAFLLSSGGYRLNVVASSAGWSDGHAFNQCSAATSASGGAGARSDTSAGDLEVCGR